MKPERDEEIETRIHMEAIVDAHDEEERSLGWYYYLEDKIQFPFTARCRHEHRHNLLKKGETVEVIAMAGEQNCEHGMEVFIQLGKDRIAVSLSQVTPPDDADEDTHEAITDWHYWADRGYQF